MRLINDKKTNFATKTRRSFSFFLYQLQLLSLSVSLSLSLCLLLLICILLTSDLLLISPVSFSPFDVHSRNWVWLIRFSVDENGAFTSVMLQIHRWNAANQICGLNQMWIVFLDVNLGRFVTHNLSEQKGKTSYRFSYLTENFHKVIRLEIAIDLCNWWWVLTGTSVGFYDRQTFFTHLVFEEKRKGIKSSIKVCELILSCLWSNWVLVLKIC